MPVLPLSEPHARPLPGTDASGLVVLNAKAIGFWYKKNRRFHGVLAAMDVGFNADSESMLMKALGDALDISPLGH